MKPGPRLIIYILFLFFLGIWVGSAFHDTVSTNMTWYEDPMIHINHMVNHPIPGAINAWVISTGLLSLITLVALIVFISYRGFGKMEVMSAVAGTLVILLTTFLYFVPTLIKIFEKTNDYSQEALIGMSQQWVILNVIRLCVLMILFLAGLIGLIKISRQPLVNR